jgi:hypothetical protein
MVSPCTISKVVETREGTGDGVGDPAFLGTFSVTVMFTGVVTLLRTYTRVSKCS